MPPPPTQQVQQISDIILNQLIPGLQGLVGPMSQVGGSVNDLNKNLKFQKEELARIGISHGKLSAAYKAQAVITGKARDAVVNMNKEMALLNKRYDENRTVLDKATAAMKVFGSVSAQALTFMGGSAINFSKMKEQVLAYNKNLLDTSRSMQAFGKGTSDLNAAFNIIRNNTSLSKVEFLGMSKAIMESAKGIGPSMTSIANMSASMEAAFGSDLESMKSNMQNFASLMEKSPTLFRTATKAMNIAQGIEKGDLNKSRNDAIQAAKAAGMGYKELMQIMKATSPMTSAQKALNESEAAIKKVKKGVDDASLAAGQKLEKAFQSCTLFAAKLLDVIEKMPSAILAVVAGLKGIPVVMQAIQAGGGGLGGIGGGLKGMWDNFKGPIGHGRAAKARGFGARAGVGAIGAIAGFGLNYLQNEAETRSGAPTTTSRTLGVLGGVAQGAALGAMAGPIGAVVGGVAGAAYGMYQNKQNDKEIAANKIAKEKNDKLLETIKLEGEVEDAKGRQIALESELMSNYERTAELAKEIAESWNQAANNVKELGTYSAREQEFLDKQVGSIRERNKSATDSKAKSLLEGSDAEAMKQLGVNANNYSAKDITGNTEKFNELISMLQASVDKKAEAINNDPAIKLMDAQLSKLETELKRYTNAKGEVNDSDDAKRNVKRILDEKEKITIAKGEKNQDVNSGQGLINRLVNTRNEATTNVKEDIKRKVDSRNLEVDASELLNNALERQLEIQNKLYSTAQFGMGASIQMMQEQVNLTKEQMELQQKRQAGADKDIKNALISRGVNEDIADNFMREVQAGMSAIESREKLGTISKRYGLDEVNLGQEINGLLVNRSDAMSKQMQAQQKIYELTKEVREGYLDAQREMSVGAGVFAKTIGTQTQGVTQLMDLVDRFGEKGSLNTLNLGGRQSSSQTAAGMGMNPMAMNTVNGMVTKDTAMVNAENTRIFRYGQSVEDTKNGKVDGRVGDATLGDTTDRMVQAVRETGQGAAKATEDGTLAALKKAGSEGIFGAINPGIGGFREHSANPNANGVTPVTRFSTDIAGAAKGAAPASPPMMGGTNSNAPVPVPEKGAKGEAGETGEKGASSEEKERLEKETREKERREKERQDQIAYWKKKKTTEINDNSGKAENKYGFVGKLYDQYRMGSRAQLKTAGGPGNEFEKEWGDRMGSVVGGSAGAVVDAFRRGGRAELKPNIPIKPDYAKENAEQEKADKAEKLRSNIAEIKAKEQVVMDEWLAKETPKEEKQNTRFTSTHSDALALAGLKETNKSSSEVAKSTGEVSTKNAQMKISARHIGSNKFGQNSKGKFNGFGGTVGGGSDRIMNRNVDDIFSDRPVVPKLKDGRIDLKKMGINEEVALPNNDEKDDKKQVIELYLSDDLKAKAKEGHDAIVRIMKGASRVMGSL